MNTLVIRHVEGSDPPRFRLLRLSDGRQAGPAVPVVSPVGFPVEGRPNTDLLGDLRWYLEEFLDYPFEPEVEHSERVLAALSRWGRGAFAALFRSGDGALYLDEATEGGDTSRLCLRIASDDPRVLAWPWEALENPGAGRLAQQCRLERRLNHVDAPPPLPADLPRDRVNILLVVARPQENDVGYHSISRPLVEMVAKENLPAEVTVLRPPTLDALREHLRAHPHTYHIVHFDGHGNYGPEAPSSGGPHTLLAPSGHLYFEDEQGKPHPVPAQALGDLLREYAVPVVVLNACRSARVSEDAPDAFASVAASLLKAGCRSVVAMAWSLYVSGAREFVPAFYRRLFASGDVAEAVRAGRQQMLSQPGRVCARGRFPLQDWLLPVVYQQEPLEFEFSPSARPAAAPAEAKLPEEAADAHNPYGFIGRDGAVLALERAMRAAPAGILIQGLGGVGKTTLARGFLRWLAQTGGLSAGCLWFGFADIRSAEFVFNRIGEALFGPNFIPQPMETKLDALARELKANRLLLVWDNFEVARGIPGAPAGGNLSEEDQALLRRFLERLRGGQTKVLITSRSDEAWLGSTNCFRLKIAGLQGEERWDFCEAVLADLGLTVDRRDPELVELMKLLDGHPLAMRAILPKLAEMPAGRIAAALRTNLGDLNLPDDEAGSILWATLRFVEDRIPAEQRALLIPLAMHEGFVSADFLESVAEQVEGAPGRPAIDVFADVLCAAGLLREVGQALYEMHPALAGYLRAAVLPACPPAERDAWTRAFADVMASVADYVANRPLQEQRVPFHLFAANFRYALSESKRLGLHLAVKEILQSLGAYAEIRHDYTDAERLFEQLSEVAARTRDWRDEGAAYHQRALVAQRQRDFCAAEHWYRKSLTTKEKAGDESGTAETYHNLGTVAQELRSFTAAEQWYRNALAIDEKLGNELGAAMAYHNLGVVAQELRDFAAAEEWYRKALAAVAKGDDELGTAPTYNQLGQLAQLRRDFAAAGQWYQAALAIRQKLGDEDGTAETCHSLGTLAQQMGDFRTAEQWYHRALAIDENTGNQHGAASAYAQLGVVAAASRRFADASLWLVRASGSFAACNDLHHAQQAMGIFIAAYVEAPPDERAKMRAIWEQAGLPDQAWPDEPA